MLGFESLFRCQRKATITRWSFFLSFGRRIVASSHSARSARGSHSLPKIGKLACQAQGEGIFASANLPIPLPKKEKTLEVVSSLFLHCDRGILPQRTKCAGFAFPPEDRQAGLPGAGRRNIRFSEPPYFAVKNKDQSLDWSLFFIHCESNGISSRRSRGYHQGRKRPCISSRVSVHFPAA